MIDPTFLLETTTQLLMALPLTLAIFVLAVAASACAGAGLTAMRISPNPVLSRAARIYIFVFRGLPLLIQIFLVYYGLGQFETVRHSAFWPFLRDPFWSATLSLALCDTAYVAEVFRGAVQAIPGTQIEAARACGMSGQLLLRRIILPQALRNVLPTYATDIMLVLKSTSLASIVTVMEVTGVAQRIISHTYRSLEVFLCAGAIYLTLNFMISRGIAWLDRRLSVPPHGVSRSGGS